MKQIWCCVLLSVAIVCTVAFAKYESEPIWRIDLVEVDKLLEPTERDLFVGSSLLRQAMPTKGTIQVDERELHWQRFAVNHLTAQEALTLSEHAIKGGVKTLWVEVWPFVRSLRPKGGDLSLPVLRWALWEFRERLKRVLPRSVLRSKLPPLDAAPKELDLAENLVEEDLQRRVSFHSPIHVDEIRALHQRATTAGATIRFITTPYNRAWKSIQEETQQRDLAAALNYFQRELGIEVLNLAHALPQKLFHDRAHMNTEGSQYFASLLADHLAARP